MRGKLESVRGNAVVGWVWDESDADGHVEFDCVVNGAIVGTFAASRMRKDLAKHGIGKGDHGYQFPIEASWLVAGTNRIEVQTRRSFRANNEALVFDYDGKAIANLRRGPRNEGRQNANPVRLNDTAAKASGGKVAAPKQEITATVRAPVATGTLVADRLYRPSKVVAPVRPATLLTLADGAMKVPGSSSLDMLSLNRVESLIASFSGIPTLQEIDFAKIIESLFKACHYEEIVMITGSLPKKIAQTYKMLNFRGRSLIYLNRLDEAIDTLEVLRAKEPKRHGAIFYLGISYARRQQYQLAYDVFTHCIVQKSDDANYQLEAGRAAIQLAFGSYGAADHKAEYVDLAIGHLAIAAELSPGDYRALRDLAPLRLHRGEHEAAHQAALAAVERNPKAVPALQTLSQICMRLGRYHEARSALETAFKLVPKADWPKFGLRIIERFDETGDARTDDIARVPVTGLPEDTIATLELALRATDSEWVYLGDRGADHTSRFVPFQFQWAAVVALDRDLPLAENLFRRSFLLRILDTGLIDRALPIEKLLVQAASHGATAGPGRAPRVRTGRPVAFLVSQYGVHEFGGVEQFLEQMARLYDALGYDVILVGTRSDYVGTSGVVGDIRFTFVENDPNELFSLALEEQVAIVHVVSGLGYEIAASMRHLDTRLVFGIHFWRELFHHPTPSSGYFPDVDWEQNPRAEFRIVLEDFAAIYSNSIFTRQITEKNFGIRTPIIYSLPDDWRDETPMPLSERHGVLLVNARVDKGFGLLLDVAARLPHVAFLLIASQSASIAAEREVQRRGLSNVTILSKVTDMSALYRTVRVVLVPSFRFIETFSRVVIEAHRLGVPLVGSDRGNVPYLLTESGVALAEDPDIWAAEVGRLTADDDYWHQRSALAKANSAAYGFEQQRDRLGRMVGAIESPILIGIGSGLGNVVHATPLIRNIARRLGRRVDVVIAGDYSDLLFCVANRDYVNHVFLLNDAVINRRYDTVFLTQSFGFLVPTFSADRVLNSRDWDIFKPDHELHEAEFNLAAAKAMMDIDYDAADVRDYYLGDLHYTPPAEPLIGFHGGSKGGIWASKRWPRYAELAEVLIAKGYRVASFGTQDEYVPGTIDMTGGSIEEMAERMIACSAFIANDSGVMNVANALGIPLVALFAPTNVTTRGPLRETSVAVAVAKDCSPCEMHATEAETRFRSGGCACIDDISVDQVLEALGTTSAMSTKHVSCLDN